MLSLSFVGYGIVSQPSSAFAQTVAGPSGAVELAQFFEAPAPAPPPAAISPPVRIIEVPTTPRDLRPGRNAAPSRPLDLNPTDDAPATPTAEADQPDTRRDRQARQFPRIGPIPPPRPWGRDNATVSADAAPEAEQPADLPATGRPNVAAGGDTAPPVPDEPQADVAQAPVLPLPVPRPDAAELTVTPPPPVETPSEVRSAALAPPRQEPVRAADPSPSRTLVVVVRADVRQPKDLDGKSVASGMASGAETGKLLSEAGLSPKTVELGFAPGLEGLARGDVDGVVLSVGPGLSAAETSGLQLGDFRLLQIPLAAEGR